MICILGAGLALAASHFTLGWSHSVTRTQWEESWSAGPAGLQITEAFVQGPGAGMEIPEGAWPVAGGWRYRPAIKPQARLILARSGTTGSGWTICAAGQCHHIGADAGAPLEIWWSPDPCPP